MGLHKYDQQEVHLQRGQSVMSSVVYSFDVQEYHISCATDQSIRSCFCLCM